MCPITVNFINFRLGKPCADIYWNYSVKTSQVKSSKRIEMNEQNKREECARFVNSIMDNCSNMIRHVDSLFSVEKLRTFCNELLFMLDVLNQLAVTSGVTTSRTYTLSYIYHSEVEVEMTRDRRIDDLGNIILDVNNVTERFKFFARWTKEIDLLNEVIRIEYTFYMYFSALVECNPEFWSNKKKPHSVFKTKSPWWDRR